MSMNQFNISLLILSAISGTLNFAGFAVIVEKTWWSLSLAALTSLGVFIALYAFWNIAFNVLPNLAKPAHRAGGWVVVILSCGLILALSTYWNLVALAGNELQKLAGSNLAIRAEQQLVKAGEAANSYQSLPPLISGLNSQIVSLSQSEQREGAISGTPGRGSFTKLLDQISNKVRATSNALASADAAVQKQISNGQKCLARDKLDSIVSCVNRIIAALNQQKVANQVRQSMSGLTAGVILPATLKGNRQKQIARTIIADIQRQADEVARVAGEIKSVPVTFASGDQPNVLQSVLLHWRSIIPAIATALALDLLPVVLLLLAIMRRRDMEAQNQNTDPTTIEELTRMTKGLDHLRRLMEPGTKS
ncbi:MAG: hypothetical protein OIF58_05140 [Cohaesibacter sp.]|nr:hypothetical protein [Cohaesibacter sp.]